MILVACQGDSGDLLPTETSSQGLALNDRNPAVDTQNGLANPDVSEDTTDSTSSVAEPLTSPPPYRPNSVFTPNSLDIGEYNEFYSQDGYAVDGVIRMDVRIANTTQGLCTIDDQSGCTLDDVKADINGQDDFTVDIDVHVSSTDLPDDGTVTNATLRQRGNSARFGPQKSFRLKLDDKDNLWRNERRLQLNKNPFEPTRFKNKLAFDLFRTVPHFPSLRTQFVNLWIDNGQGPEDYGLFTHTEFVGKEYVRNRGLDKDDNLYKIEDFRFMPTELNNLQVDAEGKPIDKDAFEAHLKIENGDDHSAVVRMMNAMNDPDRSFDSVLDEHFNRNNALTWLATNLILRQADGVTHNFYLYNPAGTDRFYFLPWDYDGTFEVELNLGNGFSNDELQKRKYYGYARGLNSRFVSRWYRQPGAHEIFVKAIDELRANFYSDAQIFQRASILNEQVAPYLTRLPDSQNVIYEPLSPQRLVTVINQNYNDITVNYDIPMEPTIIANPQVDDAGLLQLEWMPAFDVAGRNTLTYDLVISKSPLFGQDDILFSDVGIPDVTSGAVYYAVDTAVLTSPKVFVRVIARASRDPLRFWQTNSNLVRMPDGTEMFGMLEVDLP